MIALNIETRNLQALTRVKKIIKKYPEEMGEAAYEIAKDGQRNLRLELTRKGHIDTKDTWQSIQAIKKSAKSSQILIRQEGIWLDSMTPHYVPLGVGYAIDDWVLRKGNARIVQMMAEGASLKVYPHPFILNGLSRTQARMPMIIQRRLNHVLVSK